MTKGVFAAFLLLLCQSSFGEDKLPSLNDVEYSPPTEKQLERLQEYIVELEAQSVANDAFMVDCTGTLSQSSTIGPELIVVDYSFVFAENSVRRIGRYVCDKANVINELRPTAPQTRNRGPMLLSIDNQHKDLMIKNQRAKRVAIYSNGSGVPAHHLPPEKTPQKILRNLVIFNPTTACLHSVIELKDPHLETNFGAYKKKSVNGYGTKDGLVIGRWFGKPNQALAKNRDDRGLIRAIAFRDGKPVIVEDRFGVPTPTKQDRAKLYCRTEIVWGKFAGQQWPKRILGRMGSSRSYQCDLEANLDWLFDKQIPEEVFDQESVGKLGFGASQIR